MRIPIADAARVLEERGALKRHRVDHSDRIIARVKALIPGGGLPLDLADFYRELIAEIGDFHAIAPVWNDYVGWRPTAYDVTQLLPVNAIPIFDDACGSLFGVDRAPPGEVPAVYFFDHENGFSKPMWAAGSSIGVFLLLLADHDRGYRENWPDDWPLKIDPDIDKCPRAPPIWLAG